MKQAVKGLINIFDHRVRVISVVKLARWRRFSLFLAKIALTKFDGTRTHLRWLVFDRGDSVAVLVYRKSDRKICLIEQIRPATLAANGEIRAGGGGVLEIIAGSLDPGEKPLACLSREAGEEAGRRLKNIRLVTTSFMSPGATSERVAIYLADDGGDAGVAGGGVAEECEELRIHWVTISNLKKMIKKGIVVDAKTIIAFQALLLEDS